MAVRKHFFAPQHTCLSICRAAKPYGALWGETSCGEGSREHPFRWWAAFLQTIFTSLHPIAFLALILEARAWWRSLAGYWNGFFGCPFYFIFGCFEVGVCVWVLGRGLPRTMIFYLLFEQLPKRGIWFCTFFVQPSKPLKCSISCLYWWDKLWFDTLLESDLNYIKADHGILEELDPHITKPL